MGEFRMPSLGADMETGKLVEWLVTPGTRVKRGDIVATVETQKGLFEIESFEDGIMGEPLVPAGREVPVGTILALILPEETAAAAQGGAVVAPRTPAPSAPAAPPEPSAPPASPAVATARISASPSARRLATELGIDLAKVRGTGPHGVIGREDVELASRAGETTPPPAAQPTSQAQAAPTATGAIHPGMRQAIAAAMSRSNREIPHYYLETEIDLSRPLQWMEAENLKRPLRERILAAALLLKAVALALRDVPELNGYWLENQLQPRPEIHIGFAVALRQGGLMNPAIHHVDQLSLVQLMAAMGDLVERTRAGRLRGSEMTDATISVTNLGDRGPRVAFGVIYPPQVALVAFGRIMERPWAEEGMLGVRRCVTATLAADHRATDGHRGSQFLEALNRHLQQPEAL